MSFISTIGHESQFPVKTTNIRSVSQSNTHFKFDHSHPKYEKVREIVTELRVNSKNYAEFLAQLKEMSEEVFKCKRFISSIHPKEEGEALRDILAKQREEDAQIIAYIDAVADVISSTEKPDHGEKRNVLHRLLHPS